MKISIGATTASTLLASALILATTFGLHARQATSSSTSPRSAKQVLEQVQASSAEFEQLKVALNSPDQSTRMAAFDAMVNSDNPSIAELAITTAHASADEAMQALAVRAAFKAVKVFHVELTLPEHLTSNQKVFCVAAVDIPNVSFDYRRGAFENPGNPNNQGHVSGLTITFQTNQPCSGVLKQKEGTWQFEGKVSCPSGCGLTITGRASLR